MTSFLFEFADLSFFVGWKLKIRFALLRDFLFEDDPLAQVRYNIDLCNALNCCTTVQYTVLLLSAFCIVWHLTWNLLVPFFFCYLSPVVELLLGSTSVPNVLCACIGLFFLSWRFAYQFGPTTLGKLTSGFVEYRKHFQNGFGDLWCCVRSACLHFW